MSYSDNPVYMAHREKARSVFDTAFNHPDQVRLNAEEIKSPMSELCDSFAAAISLASMPPTHSEMVAISTASVMMEDSIIRWMRANPVAVQTIMKGAKK